MTKKRSQSVSHRAPAIEQPAHARAAVATSLPRTAIALFGAPAALVMQLLVSETLTSYACYPADAPRVAPVWGGIGIALSAVAAVAIAVAATADWIAWRDWQRLRAWGDAQTPANASASGPAPAPGPGSKSRVNSLQRFLATCAVLISGAFSVGLLFLVCAAALVAPCGALE